MRHGTSVILGLFIAHLAALAFGLVGILIMVPHPQLWSRDPALTQVFIWGMAYAGSLHIIFGALTMLIAGSLLLGWRRVLIFFVLATTFSLSIELLGTGTGWPFGAYEYTGGLGVKVLGRVPYSIPLSWFYMGLASFLLASLVVRARGLRGTRGAVLSVLFGAWLLVVWDLVLDPAMAHDSLPVKFWMWHQTGPYFGMPVQNFLGWAGTAVLFMGVSRWLWRVDPLAGSDALLSLSSPASASGPASGPAPQPPVGRMPMLFWVPLGIYIANTAFAAVLSASVGLWLPIVLSAVLGLTPIALGLRPPTRSRGNHGRRPWPEPVATATSSTAGG